MKRRILGWFPQRSEICNTGRSRTNFGEYFFNSLHIINSFLVSRNLFTFISVWRAIQLNVHKSDARKVNKCRERCMYTFRASFYRKRLIQINTLLKQLFRFVLENIYLVHFFEFFCTLPAVRSMNLQNRTQPINNISPIQTSHQFNDI